MRRVQGTQFPAGAWGSAPTSSSSLLRAAQNRSVLPDVFAHRVERQLEAAAKNAQTEKKEKPQKLPLPVEYEELTERLRTATGLKVKLEGTPEKGKITLQYTSEEELQRLWEWMER